ncbi:MAG: hypothetical protein D6820_06010 [Lentisphaerae bacterium]|nr:MAG: hypothetical protein D6820_06010 [Lentisphaerota bacterium]
MIVRLDYDEMSSWLDRLEGSPVRLLDVRVTDNTHLALRLQVRPEALDQLPHVPMVDLTKQQFIVVLSLQAIQGELEVRICDLDIVSSGFGGGLMKTVFGGLKQMLIAQFVTSIKQRFPAAHSEKEDCVIIPALNRYGFCLKWQDAMVENRTLRLDLLAQKP